MTTERIENLKPQEKVNRLLVAQAEKETILDTAQEYAGFTWPLNVIKKKLNEVITYIISTSNFDKKKAANAAIALLVRYIDKLTDAGRYEEAISLYNSLEAGGGSFAKLKSDRTFLSLAKYFGGNNNLEEILPAHDDLKVSKGHLYLIIGRAYLELAKNQSIEAETNRNIAEEASDQELKTKHQTLATEAEKAFQTNLNKAENLLKFSLKFSERTRSFSAPYYYKADASVAMKTVKALRGEEYDAGDISRTTLDIGANPLDVGSDQPRLRGEMKTAEIILARGRGEIIAVDLSDLSKSPVSKFWIRLAEISMYIKAGDFANANASLIFAAKLYDDVIPNNEKQPTMIPALAWGYFNVGKAKSDSNLLVTALETNPENENLAPATFWAVVSIAKREIAASGSVDALLKSGSNYTNDIGFMEANNKNPVIAKAFAKVSEEDRSKMYAAIATALDDKGYQTAAIQYAESHGAKGALEKIAWDKLKAAKNVNEIEAAVRMDKHLSNPQKAKFYAKAAELYGDYEDEKNMAAYANKALMLAIENNDIETAAIALQMIIKHEGTKDLTAYNRKRDALAGLLAILAYGYTAAVKDAVLGTYVEVALAYTIAGSDGENVSLNRSEVKKQEIDNQSSKKPSKKTTDKNPTDNLIWLAGALRDIFGDNKDTGVKDKAVQIYGEIKALLLSEIKNKNDITSERVLNLAHALEGIGTLNENVQSLKDAGILTEALLGRTQPFRIEDATSQINDIANDAASVSSQDEKYIEILALYINLQAKVFLEVNDKGQRKLYALDIQTQIERNRKVLAELGVGVRAQVLVIIGKASDAIEILESELSSLSANSNTEEASRNVSLLIWAYMEAKEYNKAIALINGLFGTIVNIAGEEKFNTVVSWIVANKDKLMTQNEKYLSPIKLYPQLGRAYAEINKLEEAVAAYTRAMATLDKAIKSLTDGIKKAEYEKEYKKLRLELIGIYAKVSDGYLEAGQYQEVIAIQVDSKAVKNLADLDAIRQDIVDLKNQGASDEDVVLAYLSLSWLCVNVGKAYRGLAETGKSKNDAFVPYYEKSIEVNNDILVEAKGQEKGLTVKLAEDVTISRATVMLSNAGLTQAMGEVDSQKLEQAETLYRTLIDEITGDGSLEKEEKLYYAEAYIGLAEIHLARAKANKEEVLIAAAFTAIEHVFYVIPILNDSNGPDYLKKVSKLRTRFVAALIWGLSSSDKLEDALLVLSFIILKGKRPDSSAWEKINNNAKAKLNSLDKIAAYLLDPKNAELLAQFSKRFDMKANYLRVLAKKASENTTEDITLFAQAVADYNLMLANIKIEDVAEDKRLSVATTFVGMSDLFLQNKQYMSAKQALAAADALIQKVAITDENKIEIGRLINRIHFGASKILLSGKDKKGARGALAELNAIINSDNSASTDQEDIKIKALAYLELINVQSKLENRELTTVDWPVIRYNMAIRAIESISDIKVKNRFAALARLNVGNVYLASNTTQEASKAQPLIAEGIAILQTAEDPEDKNILHELYFAQARAFAILGEYSQALIAQKKAAVLPKDRGPELKRDLFNKALEPSVALNYKLTHAGNSWLQAGGVAFKHGRLNLSGAFRQELGYMSEELTGNKGETSRRVDTGALNLYSFGVGLDNIFNLGLRAGYSITYASASPVYNAYGARVMDEDYQITNYVESAREQYSEPFSSVAPAIHIGLGREFRTKNENISAGFDINGSGSYLFVNSTPPIIEAETQNKREFPASAPSNNRVAEGVSGNVEFKGTGAYRKGPFQLRFALGIGGGYDLTNTTVYGFWPRAVGQNFGQVNGLFDFDAKWDVTDFARVFIGGNLRAGLPSAGLNSTNQAYIAAGIDFHSPTLEKVLGVESFGVSVGYLGLKNTTDNITPWSNKNDFWLGLKLTL